MPKKAIDFSRNLIYKIVCKDLTITELYVGHTSNFRVRKNTHKSSCNNEKAKGYNYKVYSYIRDNGGFENWSMIEIEKYPCNDANECSARERYWIETLKANLNINIPSRTYKEYRELNKEKIKERQKERDKEYYKQNKEEIKEKLKEYQQLNRDKINQKQRERYALKKGITP